MLWTVVSRVLDHSYNRPGSLAGPCTKIFDLFANRVPIWKETLGERFINDDNVSAVDSVSGIEIASLQQRNLHGLEIVRRNGLSAHGRFFPRLRGKLTRHMERSLQVTECPFEWLILVHCSVDNSRELTHFCQHRVEQISNARHVRVLPARRIDVGAQNMMRIESERQAMNRLEATNEQARPNEQHAGKCHLPSNYQGLRSLPLWTDRSGATTFIPQRGLRKTQRRQ